MAKFDIKRTIGTVAATAALVRRPLRPEHRHRQRRLRQLGRRRAV